MQDTFHHEILYRGDEAMAREEARNLFTWHRVTQTSPEQLMAARRRLADRIESLQ